MNPSHKASIAILLASFLYGLQGIFMRLIGIDFGVFYPFAVRGLIISTIFLVFLYLKQGFKKIAPSDCKWFGLMPVFGILTFITIFIAFGHLNIGTVLFIHFATFAVSGFLLGYIVFQERLNLAKVTSLVLSLTGLSLIFSISFSQNELLYFAFAFISGLGNIGWYLSSKKISSKYPSSQILAIDSVVVFVLCLVFAVLRQENLSIPNFSIQWVSVLGLTATSFFAFILTVYGFRILQAQIATLILLLEVIFGPILAWIFFKEVLAPLALLGGFLIFIGVILPNISFARETEK